jgi:hypothetical protein
MNTSSEELDQLRSDFSEHLLTDVTDYSLDEGLDIRGRLEVSDDTDECKEDGDITGLNDSDYTEKAVQEISHNDETKVLSSDDKRHFLPSEIVLLPASDITKGIESMSKSSRTELPGESHG